MSMRPTSWPYEDEPSSTSSTAIASGCLSPFVPVLSVATYASFSCSAAAASAGEE
jgi:hypothetical protein